MFRSYDTRDNARCQLLNISTNRSHTVKQLNPINGRPNSTYHRTLYLFRVTLVDNSNGTHTKFTNKGRFRMVLAIQHNHGRPINRIRSFQHQAVINIRVSVNNRQPRFVNRARRVPTKNANGQMSNLNQVTRSTCITIRHTLTIESSPTRPRNRRPILRKQSILVLISNRPTSNKAGLNNNFKGVVRSVTCRRRGVIGVSFTAQNLFLLMNTMSINRPDNIRSNKQLPVNSNANPYVVFRHRRQSFNPVSFNRRVTGNRQVNVNAYNNTSSHTKSSIALVFSRVQR